MRFTDSHYRQQLIAWAQSVRDLVADRDKSAASQIDQAIGAFSAQRFTLTVLGKAKRGKSTLINALLGRVDDQLAPVDRLPASNVITRFSWGATEHATVHYRSASENTPPSSASIHVSQIRDYVTEEFNPDNSKQVEVVEVQAPFQNFDHDLVLIDTPGAGSIHEYHDSLLHAVIPQSDAVIFMVTARMPIDQDELELLQKLKASEIKKIVFVINKIDATSAEDLASAVAHNRSVLQSVGIVVDELHQISAKAAFEGDHAKSHLGDLTSEIHKLFRTGKSDLLADRFQSKISEIARPALQGLISEAALLEKSGAELSQYAANLSESRDRVQADLESFERLFLKRWESALDHFRAKLPNVREILKKDILDYIKQKSSLELSKLTRELPSLLSKGVDAHLLGPSQALELELQKLTQELHNHYASLDLAIPDLMSLNVRGDQSFAKRAAAGLVTASVGAGLATAASAAAVGTATMTTIALPAVVTKISIIAKIVGMAGVATTSSAPAWVVMAGPIGWTLGGVGLLALPFAWSLSRSKQKEKLEDECIKQIESVIHFIKEERIPSILKSGELVLLEYRDRSLKELRELEKSIERAQQRQSSSTADPNKIHALLDQFQSTMNPPRRIAHEPT